MNAIRGNAVGDPLFINILDFANASALSGFPFAGLSTRPDELGLASKT